MKLSDMKMSKKDKKESMPQSTGTSDGPDYPYGLQLRLDNASLEKLGIKSLPKVGAKMQVSGIGVVTAVSSHESKNRDDRNVEIQIQQLGIESEGPKMEETLQRRFKALKSGDAA